MLKSRATYNRDRRCRLTKTLEDHGVGLGFYSVLEAVRYSGLPAQTVRNFMLGYRVGERVGKTLLRGDFVQAQEGGRLHVDTLSFRDVIELRIIARLRELDVPTPEIHRAAQRLSELWKTSHPFCSQDGLAVFRGKIVARLLEGAKGISHFREVVTDQKLIARVVTPFLDEVEFQQHMPTKWTPKVGRGRVVLDPRCSFGRAIVKRGMVPTAVLRNAWKSHDEDAAGVAAWYGVEAEDVRSAVAFEVSLDPRQAA